MTQFVPAPEPIDVTREEFLRAASVRECPKCGEPVQIDREQLKYPSVDGSHYIYAGVKTWLTCGKHVAFAIL